MAVQGVIAMGKSLALEIQTSDGTIVFLGSLDPTTSEIGGTFTISGGTCDKTFGFAWKVLRAFRNCYLRQIEADRVVKRNLNDTQPAHSHDALEREFFRCTPQLLTSKSPKFRLRVPEIS